MEVLNEYYYGPGDGRAPIMGTSYYAPRGLWWYGTSSTGPNNYQDDMAIIASATNTFGYRADDISSSTPLAVTGREVSGAGIIERTTDQDSFTFTVGASGEMNLSVDVAADVGNLNARLELRTSLGTLLAASDPASFGYKRTITYNVTPGNYVLVAASHAGYGDVGQYTVSGTIPVPSTIATPTNLVASAITTNQIDLSWVDNAANEDGYLVERSTTGGPVWTAIATLAADSTGYSDSTAAAGTTSYYRVSAFNSGDASSYSNQASATTVPDAPGNLTATTVWSNAINLAWGSVTNATSYKLERSADGGNSWTQISSQPDTEAETYSDTGLQASTTYSYRVTASGAGGDSAYSNIASATTFAAVPTEFGSQDGAYVADNWGGSYYDVKIQSTDQKIVAAGVANGSVVIGRYNSQGSVDSAYGSGGISNPALGSGSELYPSLVLQADGKPVVSFSVSSLTPSFTWTLQHGVVRFNNNGALDTGFGTGGWKTIDVRSDDGISFSRTAVGLQSTGKLVIAHQSTSPSSGNPALIARFTTSGALDSGKSGFGTVSQGKALGYTLSTFGGSSNSFGDLVVQPDDKIVAIGSSTGVAGLLVARYSANGALDTSFNGSGYGFYLSAVGALARGVARQSDGKLIVVGSAPGIDGSFDMLVARLNSNGTLDTSFGGGAGYVRLDVDGTASLTLENGADVVIQSDGKIVAVGNEYLVSAGYLTSSVLVARFNSNGTPDTTFAPGGFKLGTRPPELGSPGMTARSVALQSNGNIIVAGDTLGHPFLMRFYGTASPLQAASTATTTSTQSITLAQVQPLLTEALARWQSAGYDISSLTNIDLRIADLPGNTLGQAQGQTITLDSNAAGWGWFVDPTPRSDSEFTTPGNQGEKNRMDLLTVLAHELGHVLGNDHSEDGVMANTLATGVRRMSMSGTEWFAAVEAVFYESSSLKRRA